MAILDEMLQEEYERMKRMRAKMQAEAEELPNGYISKKSIHGKQYCYLQKREGNKVVSRFVRAGDVALLEEQIERRRQLKVSLREIDVNMRKIEKVIRG